MPMTAAECRARAEQLVELRGVGGVISVENADAARTYALLAIAAAKEEHTAALTALPANN